MSNFKQELSRRLKLAGKASRQERRARERHPEKVIKEEKKEHGKEKQGI